MASNDSPFGGFQFPGFSNPLGSTVQDNPVVSTLTGSMDFMKHLWGSAASGGSLGQLAGFVAPTLDIEELDRKITDLKAVEGWLQTNAAMLRATVQALEVQRNTIVALKSFGNLMAEGVSAAPASAPSPSPAAAGVTPAARTSSGLPPGWPMPASAAPAPAAAPAQAPKKPAAPRKSSAARTASSAAGAGFASKTLAEGAALASEATNASINNAAAWWGMLQDQFAKVAGAAVANAVPAGKPAAKAAGKAAPGKTGGAARGKAGGASTASAGTRPEARAGAAAPASPARDQGAAPRMPSAAPAGKPAARSKRAGAPRPKRPARP